MIGPATREEGLQRLAAFVPRAGRAYAKSRNVDLGPADRTNVSGLSPYVRHRLITEQDIATAVMAIHTHSAAEKFMQEVCWRTYWKGWLETRPIVWQRYLGEVAHLNACGFSRDPDMQRRYAEACNGRTGISCFNAWIRELVETGYLHNHTRMWVASIWVHTLGLPWQLGADIFMRHLLDGDPASNTLSWRWVAGLHTEGKTYLARSANIETYTSGRFVPSEQLASTPVHLTDGLNSSMRGARLTENETEPSGRVALLITEEDLNPETWPLSKVAVNSILLADTSRAYPNVSDKVAAFKKAALASTSERLSAHFGCEAKICDVDKLQASFPTIGEKIVTMVPPVGPAASELAPVFHQLRAHGIELAMLRRQWDSAFWPHATHGFFKLKDKIPAVLKKLGVIDQPQHTFDLG